MIYQATKPNNFSITRNDVLFLFYNFINTINNNSRFDINIFCQNISFYMSRNFQSQRFQCHNISFHPTGNQSRRTLYVSFDLPFFRNHYPFRCYNIPFKIQSIRTALSARKSPVIVVLVGKFINASTCTSSSDSFRSFFLFLKNIPLINHYIQQMLRKC